MADEAGTVRSVELGVRANCELRSGRGNRLEFRFPEGGGFRVVCVGDDPTIGRKPTFYLDRHGELIALPRDIHPVKGDQAERGAPR